MSLLYKTISYFFPSIAGEASCCEYDANVKSIDWILTEPLRCEHDANVKSIDWILTEAWFIENPDLQLDLLKICWANMAHLVNTTPDEKTFTENITDIVLYKLPAKFCGYQFLETLVQDIHDGDFLLTQAWFLNSIERQVDVAVAALNNICHMIDVFHENFDVHLDSLLKEHCFNMRGKGFLKEYASDKYYENEDEFDFADICNLNATDEEGEEGEEGDEDDDAEFEYRYPSNEDFDDFEYYEAEQNYHTFEPQDDKDEDYWNERSYKMHLQRISQQKPTVCSDKYRLD